MKINYIGTFKADIYCDGRMIYCGVNDDFHSLQEYIDKAIFLMGKYHFVQAQIVDNDTEELLVTVDIDD